MRFALLSATLLAATVWADDSSTTTDSSTSTDSTSTTDSSSSTSSSSSSSSSISSGSSSSSSSSSSTSTTGDSSTITGTSTIPSVGASSNGPAEIAFKYCFPSKFASIATDTPCYSMEVLNQACYYGPSVFQTATATPTSHASPKQQQDCYCNEASGVGYMYFQFMQGCSDCFRGHGALGSYGAYNSEFISSLSSRYCGVSSPTQNFGAFLTSFQANTVTTTVDASTSNVLGTQTDVSLYYTTHLTGGFANATSNSTGMGTGTGRGTGTGTAGPTAPAYVNTTSTDSSSEPTSSSTDGSNSTSSSSSSSSASQDSISSIAGAPTVQVTGAFGLFLLGLAAML